MSKTAEKLIDRNQFADCKPTTRLDRPAFVFI